MVLGFLGNSHISSTFGQAVSSHSLEVVSGGAAENERVPENWRRKGAATPGSQSLSLYLQCQEKVGSPNASENF